MRTTAALILAVAMLAGCAGAHSLAPGQSTEADVRARMGNPKDTRTESNGDKVWDYPTGPEGFYTHQVRIGADGKVRQVTQLLTEERFTTIVPGKTTKAEVRTLLGRPMDDTHYRAGETWSYRYLRMGVSPGYMVVKFNPDGTVAERIVIIDPSGDTPED
jgi:outer membrane protein assembly factor BamE (lipoprotein component of BamABCDE complex)